jgi:hypothetical protein
MAKLLQVFLGADLRNSHEGLSAIAKANRIDPDTLPPGDYIIFINTARDKLKLYAANQVLAYLKLKTGKIDLRTISLIPQAFKASGKIQYDETLKELLLGKMKA